MTFSTDRLAKLGRGLVRHNICLTFEDKVIGWKKNAPSSSLFLVCVS